MNKQKYAKLRGRIVEVYGTQKDFIEAMGAPVSTIAPKLCGKIDWKSGEIMKACEVLNIPIEEAHTYFFEQ